MDEVMRGVERARMRIGLDWLIRRFTRKESITNLYKSQHTEGFAACIKAYCHVLQLAPQTSSKKGNTSNLNNE